MFDLCLERRDNLPLFYLTLLKPSNFGLEILNVVLSPRSETARCLSVLFEPCLRFGLTLFRGHFRELELPPPAPCWFMIRRECPSVIKRRQ